MVTLKIEIEQEFYLKLKAITDSLGTTIEAVTVRFLHWCVEEPEAATKYLLDAIEKHKGEPEICRVRLISNRRPKMNNIHRVTKMVPWQESWSEIFACEQRQIECALSSAGLHGTIYHIGSTSVKDMISKPIIDILLCPDEETSLEAYIPILEGLGYTNLGECGSPGRYFFSKGNEENHTFYLHLCSEDHPVAVDQKLFQLIERNDEGVFLSYMRLKNTLVTMFPLDRDMYRTVKGMFIEGVLSAYRLGRQSQAADESE